MNGRASKEKRSTARNEVVGQSMGCEHEQPCIPSDLVRFSHLFRNPHLNQGLPSISPSIAVALEESNVSLP